jgi:hypothetical protein
MAAIYRRQAVEAAALSLLIGAGMELQAADLRLAIRQFRSSFHRTFSTDIGNAACIGSRAGHRLGTQSGGWELGRHCRPRVVFTLYSIAPPKRAWQMWQQCLKTTDLRIVDVRVTEKAGEVAK